MLIDLKPVNNTSNDNISYFKWVACINLSH